MSCHDCIPKFECHILNDGRAIIQTEIASTLSAEDLTTCPKRLNRLQEDSNNKLHVILQHNKEDR